MKKLVVSIMVVFAVMLSVAYAFCGDGRINGNEECDGNDFDGMDCSGFNYSRGDLKCSSNCTLDRSSCFNLEGTTCEEILSGEDNAGCSPSGDGGYSCNVNASGTINSTQLCDEFEGLKVWLVRDTINPLKAEVIASTYDGATLSYSVDGKKFREVCSDCSGFSKVLRFRYGPHNLRIKAEFEGREPKEESLWLHFLRQQVEREGMTFWYGNTVKGTFTQGYSEFRKIITLNIKQPFGELVDTKVKISAVNLPGIEDDEEYAVWMYKNSTDFMKLGNLKLNKRYETSPFRSNIRGYYMNSWYDAPYIDEYDGVLIEIEPDGYNLPYPSTETVMWYNKEPARNFLVNGTACINGRQCVSGFCDDGACS